MGTESRPHNALPCTPPPAGPRTRIPQRQVQRLRPRLPHHQRGLHLRQASRLRLELGRLQALQAHWMPEVFLPDPSRTTHPSTSPIVDVIDAAESTLEIGTPGFSSWDNCTHFS